MPNYIPLVTTLVSAVLTLLVWRQFAERRKLYQLVWGISLSLFGLGALLEFLMNPDVIGPNDLSVKAYYLTVAPQVSLLGTGVVILLSPKWGRRILPVVVALSTVVVALGSSATINAPALAESFERSVVFGIRDAARSFPQPVRLLTIGLNIYGAITLIGGSVLSFVKDRRRTYALLIVAGGLLNAIGGTLLGISGNPDVFLEFELLGAVALFAGVLMSGRMASLGPQQAPLPVVSSPFRLPSSRRFALAAIFGAVIFTSKVFAPTPVKDSLIVVQALLLGLGALLLTPLGATLVAAIGGLLTASWNPNLAIFTVLFAALYGLLIDSTVWALKARRGRVDVSGKRFTAAITLSTAVIGLLAYATTIILGLLPRNPAAELFILVGGIVSGVIGGYLAVVVWRRAARYLVV